MKTRRTPWLAAFLVLALLLWGGVARGTPTADQQLKDAVKQCDVVRVKVLLEEGARLNPMDKTGRTILMDAVLEGNLEIVRLLVDKGANVNARDYWGGTPLGIAARRGHTEIVELLKERGAEVTLGIAAMIGDTEDCRHLIKDGVDPNDPKQWLSGQSPLMIAAQRNHIEVAKLLVESGADVEVRDFAYRTALLLATETGNLETGKLLVENGADVCAFCEKNERAVTPLMAAASQGDLAMVKVLLARTSELKDMRPCLSSALLLSAANGHLAVLELLTEKGADINVKDDKDKTALILSADSGHYAVVRLLLDKGADVNARDCSGRTALDYVKGGNNMTIVEMLKAHGAKE